MEGFWLKGGRGGVEVGPWLGQCSARPGGGDWEKHSLSL